MSLRRGHLRSRMWAPPAYRDEWQDEATCRGMMNDMIPVSICQTCPVKQQCQALFNEMDEYLDDGTQRSLRMIGTYAGVKHGSEPSDVIGRPRTNTGECISPGCEKKQATRKMCTMHYQRHRNAGGKWSIQ